MEDWQVMKLVETDESGFKHQIGGGISRMSIGGVNGPLHQIDVQPLTTEQMMGELWDGKFVRLQVADRVVWMEPKEVETLIELMKLAHDASLRNYDLANS